MKVNHKPNDLPQEPADLWATTRPLVIDNYLSRQGVVDHIMDAVGIDVNPSDGSFNHLELSHLLRWKDDQEGRGPEDIKDQDPKYSVIERLGEVYGFPTRPDQAKLMKSQLIHILITETVDDDPQRFTLPTEPDIWDTPDPKPGSSARTPRVAR